MIAVVVRFLGLQALARLSSRLPLYWGWLLAVGLMVAANVAPLLSLGASWGIGDLLLFYAIENALIIVTVTVRLLTYSPREPWDAMSRNTPSWMTGSAFMAIVFAAIAGAFTIAGMIMAIIGSAKIGYEGSWLSWAINAVLLLLGQLGVLAVFWFGQDERRYARHAAFIGFPPLPRVMGLHVLGILSLALPSDELGFPLMIVVAVKIVWDFALMVIDLIVRRRARA